VKHTKEVVVLQRNRTKKRNGSRKLEIKQVVGELSRNKVVKIQIVGLPSRDAILFTTVRTLSPIHTL
jgi:hypothetical protein